MGKENEKEARGEVIEKDRIGQDLELIQTVYPDAEALFAFSLEPVEAVKDKCLFALDANALLLPYVTSAHSLEEIGKTYKELIRQDRLIVPGQAVREFAKHRPEKIGNMVKTWSDFKSKITAVNDLTFPILENTERYENFRELRQQANNLIEKCKEAVGDTVNMVRAWQLNDPVSSLYRELFTKGAVVDLTVDDKTIREEKERRKKNTIPPGYKDLGIGDLVIWQTILKVGREKQQPLVFISGEEKADWFHSSDNRTLFPRYELIDEYRRVSGGQAFYILNLAELLSLFSAPQQTVDEVKEAQKTAALKAEKIKKGRDVILPWSMREEVAEYLALPIDKRTEWARRLLNAIEHYDRLGLGEIIESRWDLMNRLFKAEESEEVRQQLQPLLNEVNAEMEGMIQDLAQENP